MLTMYLGRCVGRVACQNMINYVVYYVFLARVCSVVNDRFLNLK